MKLDKSKAFLSVCYSLLTISAGLLLHPYQTMQNLSQDKIFEFLIILPSVFLLLVVFIWRLILVPLVRLFFTCQTSNLIFCEFLPFMAHFIILFCACWQVMILYLWLRFRVLKD